METTTAQFLTPADTGKQIAFVDSSGRYVQGPMTDVARPQVAKTIWIELAGRVFEADPTAKVEVA